MRPGTPSFNESGAHVTPGDVRVPTTDLSSRNWQRHQVLSQGERRLAAIMFTDMVGYTALTQSNERRAMEVLERHNGVLRPFFPKFHGREVKAIGDSFLVEFDSALEAVECAHSIQTYLHEYNASLGEGWKIRLRIGIHLGDVIHQGGDVFGDAVNLASRLQPLADPEGICVSDQVYGQVRNKVPQTLVKLARQDLKGVSSPMEVYKVVMPWDDGPGPGSQLDPRRIVVLPFVSLSPDPNDEYFADGLTEELITKVSYVQGLEVIARTSAMNYKKKDLNASKIAQELRVGTLLEGSVRKAGNRIRINAQLINASTEGHLWADSYDRDLDDIFAVQSSVAEHVATALKLRLVEGEDGEGMRTTDPDTYTMYLRAKRLFADGTDSSDRRALPLLEEVVRRDPRFVKGYATLTIVLWRVASGQPSYTAGVAKAEAVARKALELDPNSGEAHVAMASVYSANDRFGECMEELRQAVEINPNLVEAHALLGFVKLSFGRAEEALVSYRKAYSLDPLSLNLGNLVATGLRCLGKTDEAIELLERLKARDPDSPIPHTNLAACYAQMEDFKRAKEEAESARRLDPAAAFPRMALGQVYALMGKRTEAEDVLRGLEDQPEAQRLNAVVFIRGQLGDLDVAFEALMKLAELHSWFPFVKADPLMANVQRDPRFQVFCRKVGLVA